MTRREWTPAEMRELTARTIGHYEGAAESFREGTWTHDVTQNYEALLSSIEGQKPFRILDFGCGPGRDLAYFRSLGHEAVGIDGALPFVEMARASSGCEVWHQNFLDLSLGVERFDGIFANASLFHVPSPALGQVLDALFAALVPRGVLFCSNPRGGDEEGYSASRYGAYYLLETWTDRVTKAGFSYVAHYYRPAGKPRAEQPWLATVWRADRPRTIAT